MPVIKMGGVAWIRLAQYRDLQQATTHRNESLSSIPAGNTSLEF
jgi:hypothetical protein